MRYHLFVLILAIINAENSRTNSIIDRIFKCSWLSDVLECDEHKNNLLNNTVCEKFCNNTSPGYCTIVDGPKCVCGPGYARESDNGQCIPLTKCKETYPPNCGPNEILTDCASVCPRACLGKNTTEDLSRCTLCFTGCVCKPGFIKVVKFGTCVPEGHCSMICTNDEVYKDCGSACPPTCENPKPNCTKSCEKGCFCKEGLIRDQRTGRCVKRSCCGPFAKNITIF